MMYDPTEIRESDVDLIHRYLFDELSPAEAAMVRARIDYDPEFAASLQRLEFAVRLGQEDLRSAGEELPTTTDTHLELFWRRMAKIHAPPVPQAPSHALPNTSPNASRQTLSDALGLGDLVLSDEVLPTLYNGSPVISAVNNAVSLASTNAEPQNAELSIRPTANPGIHLSDRRNRVAQLFRHLPTQRVAAAAGIVAIAAATSATWPWLSSLAGMVGITSGTHRTSHLPVADDETHVLRWTPPGQRTAFALGDQTHVELGGGSELSYSRPFGQLHRDIWIKGRLYLYIPDVPNDGSVAPLVVHIRGGTATVEPGYEAAFEITDRSDLNESGCEVRVDKGEVLLHPDASAAVHDSTWHIYPGRKALLRDGIVTVTASGVNGSVSWRGVELAFNSVPLREIVRELNRWYNFHFVLVAPDAMGDALVSVDGIDISAPSYAQRLADQANLDVTQTGDTFTFTPKMSHP